MRHGDRSRGTRTPRVQDAWKQVEWFWQEPHRSKQDDDRLCEQFKLLLEEHEGLDHLSQHVKNRVRWPGGAPFLDLLSRCVSEALNGGRAPKYERKFQELANAITRLCGSGSGRNNVRLAILHRLNFNEFLDALARVLFPLLERDRQSDPLAVVEGLLDSRLPQQEWRRIFQRLVEKTKNHAIRGRLKKASERLGRNSDQAPRGAAEGRQGTVNAPGREEAPMLKTPSQSPDNPPEKVLATPSQTTGGGRSAGEDRPMDPSLASSEQRPAAEPSTDARAGADAAARTDDMRVTENGPEAESVTSGNPVAGEAPARTSKQSTDGPGGPAGAVGGVPASGQSVEAHTPEGRAVEPATDAADRPGSPGATEPPPPDEQAAADPGSASEPGPGGRKKSRANPSKKSKGPAKPAPDADRPSIEEYLAGVTQELVSRFQACDKELQDLRQRFDGVEKENEQRKSELEKARWEAGNAASDLDTERANSKKLSDTNSDLNSQLVASRQETLEAKGRAAKLDTELEAAHRELTETKRRADDRVHRAEQAGDRSVKTFQNTLKDRLEPHFSEVLDEGGEPAQLGADQRRLYERLRKILGVLRESDVMLGG